MERIEKRKQSLLPSITQTQSQFLQIVQRKYTHLSKNPRMEASMHTAARRAATIYINARDLAPRKGASLRGTTIATKREGETLNLLFEPQATAIPANPAQKSTLPSAISIINIGIHDLMKYIQSLNPGPTRASRLLYIWFFSVTAAYNWVSPTAHTHINGTHDGWDWSTRRVLEPTLQNNIYSWITYALTQIMPQFVAGYDTTTILATERAALKLTPIQQTERHNIVKELGNWTEFWAVWRTWYAARTADGATAAAVAPTATQLPNGESVLEVSNTVDPATFPQPHAWTPLKVGVKTQKYLTYGWNDVRSSCLTVGDEAAIKAAALAHYVTGAARTAEIAEVVEITNHLTDTQKMIAEFWAGGPGSVSPPCIAFVLWNIFIFAYGQTRVPLHYDTYFFSGLEMAIHVFEAGRLIWGLKKQAMQARPIQEIRAAYRGQTLKNGFGAVVQGESWTPFQETHFVTPPFADFPSGHSGFSQVFALVMTKWFGAVIPSTVPLADVDLSLISPVFPALSPITFPTFIMPAGASQIQPGGAVPAADITLTWTTWQEMADSAGISRKYGGIHATSAHTSSQALGLALHTAITNRWNVV